MYRKKGQKSKIVMRLLEGSYGDPSVIPWTYHAQSTDDSLLIYNR